MSDKVITFYAENLEEFSSDTNVIETNDPITNIENTENTVNIIEDKTPDLQVVVEVDSQVNIDDVKNIIDIVEDTTQGPPGVGMPVGGKIGQVLEKLSDKDYDFGWVYYVYVADTLDKFPSIGSSSCLYIDKSTFGLYMWSNTDNKYMPTASGGLVSEATTTTKGVVRLATGEETIEATNDSIAITPKNLNVANVDGANKLRTPRKINQVYFDGTQDITITDDTKISKDGGIISGDILPEENDTVSLGSSIKKYLNIFASKFIGTFQGYLEGTAEKAVGDESGNTISVTYLKRDGTNSITGDLVPENDNTVNIGTENKKIKVIYADKLEGTAAKAEKLAKTVKVGFADFDGSNNISLSDIGVIVSNKDPDNTVGENGELWVNDNN
jgi:hypothetical protein